MTMGKKDRNPNGPVNIHLRRGIRGFRWSVTLSGECVECGKERTRDLAHDAAADVARPLGWNGKSRRRAS